MIAEKIPLDFDFNALREDVIKIKAKYPIVSQSDYFGGWSITSSDGDYRDGWQKGHKIYEKSPNLTREEFKIELEKLGMKPTYFFRIKTDICTPSFSKLVDTIESHNLSPYRCRIIELKKGGASTWHRDAANDRYAVRLHIPLITNSECFFKTETEQVHMPADGSAYLIHVNRLHQVVNGGTEDRYHFVCDVIDRNGISVHHKFTG